MNARDFHVVGQRPDWAPPPRVTTPEPRAVASIEAWRSSPAVMREKRRSFLVGFGAGFGAAMAVYGVGSAVLVLVFVHLGFRP